MVNPTAKWDTVPVYGWYFELDGVTPKTGKVLLNLNQRVNSKDGRNIFPGGTVSVDLGGSNNDTAAMNQVRSAMRIVDQAAVEAGGGTFDAAAWDADWDARVPAAFFTSFPASDDPDIVQGGYKVTVTEKLNGDPGGKVYQIQPLLSMLDDPIPGLNVGTVDVPPGAPTAPAPIYQKGAPGGVAPLDETAKVPLVNLPDSLGGGGSATWGSIAGQPAVIAAGATEQEALDAIGAAAVADIPTADTLTGATTVGKALVKAADAAAARYAIEAGTSNVVVGTQSGQAADAATTAAAIVAKLDATQKGAANGVATLDGSLKIPSAQMPDIAIVNYLGAVGSQAAMLALVGQRGDWAIRTDLGTTWTITGDDPTQLGNWVQLSYPTAPVTSVANKTGAVTLAASDVGAVPTTRTINGKPLSADVSLAASDVSAVPTTRTVNGKALSANVTLSASDVGAATPAQIPTADTLSGATTVGKAVVQAATATDGREGLKIFVVQPGADPANYDDDAILYYLATATLTVPTMKGYTSVNEGTTVTNVTIDPSVNTQGTAISTGDWMFLTYMGSATVAPTTPAGWVVVADLGHFNTRYAIVYGRVRQAGDTSYNVTIQSNVNGSQFALIWGAGADTTIADWLAGAAAAASGSVSSITAPAVTTTTPSLVLTLAFEASTVNETDITSMTGATKWFFVPQADTGIQIHTLAVGYVEQSAAGATSGVTVVYPNASPNIAAVQISLPGVS